MSDQSQPGSGDQQDGLVDALVQAAFRTTRVLSAVGAEHDLSLTQLRVLAILADRRLRMSELADYLGLDKSSMSGLIDRAAARGLLERVPNPADRRVVDVQLTRDGYQLTAHLTHQVGEQVSALTSRLTPAEGRRLTALLGRLLNNGGPRTSPVAP